MQCHILHVMTLHGMQHTPSARPCTTVPLANLRTWAWTQETHERPGKDPLQPAHRVHGVNVAARLPACAHVSRLLRGCNRFAPPHDIAWQPLWRRHSPWLHWHYG